MIAKVNLVNNVNNWSNVKRVRRVSGTHEAEIWNAGSSWPLGRGQSVDGRPEQCSQVWGQDTSEHSVSNGRCLTHGGASTGPRTAEGRVWSRRARWKRGLYSADARVEQKLVQELLQLSQSREPTKPNASPVDVKG